MRLRCKVLEHEGKTYLVSVGVASLMSHWVTAYAMSEEHTFKLDMSTEEYNALPYHWFEDTGPADHPHRLWPR